MAARSVVGFVLGVACAAPCYGQAPKPDPTPTATPAPQEPAYLRDRGPGLPVSMFGTYIERGQWIVYPFYEGYDAHQFEYTPAEFGFAGDTDFHGHYRAHEGILFVAYGLRDNLSFEIEAAVIKATLTKDPLDTSAMPGTQTESGLGDVEGQIRWRWRHETARAPDVFSYAELVIPHAKEKNLIGTPGVEVAAGVGVIKGLPWGTLTFRGGVEFDQSSESHFDVGEYAVEYLKRLSPKFRILLCLEGTQNELSAIGELQWHLRPGAMIKVNLGRGLTSTATDWAPEIGMLFTWPQRR